MNLELPRFLLRCVKLECIKFKLKLDHNPSYAAIAKPKWVCIHYIFLLNNRSAVLKRTIKLFQIQFSLI